MRLQFTYSMEPDHCSWPEADIGELRLAGPLSLSSPIATIDAAFLLDPTQISGR
jgi:hypothetical protein